MTVPAYIGRMIAEAKPPQLRSMLRDTEATIDRDVHGATGPGFRHNGITTTLEQLRDEHLPRAVDVLRGKVGDEYLPATVAETRRRLAAAVADLDGLAEAIAVRAYIKERLIATTGQSA